MTEISKADVLAWMDEGYARFRASWRAADAGRMTAPLLEGGWSFLDLLGHCSAWHELTARRLQYYAETGSLDVPGVDLSDDAALNAAFVAERRGRGAEEILQELDKTFRVFRGAVAALAEDPIDSDSYVYFVIEANGPGHYSEHEDQIAAWMASGSAQT